ncbi:hypothetical protein ILUMI_15162 [Ignelater luminosus]|uniref:Uncharacterized protein n=1 Tax=Ignelater luminosus TaxID=2038154 RepID=A0A8K0CTK5_IGNLU|nr:hypothetical protein ILUMI_15162 [Ignelater luminosus]
MDDDSGVQTYGPSELISESSSNEAAHTAVVKAENRTVKKQRGEPNKGSNENNAENNAQKKLSRKRPRNESKKRDCMHSVIEKAIKRSLRSGPIFLPAQHVIIHNTISQKAGMPYKVKSFLHDDILDLKALLENLGHTNFKLNKFGQTVNWLEVKEFRVQKNREDILLYKINHDKQQYYAISVKKRRNRCNGSSDEMMIPSVYSASQKISSTKRDGLMKLIKALFGHLISAIFITWSYHSNCLISTLSTSLPIAIETPLFALASWFSPLYMCI